jgi:NAD(P)-dependent dehydrogenase (short-subunit alcohol dehydrogenase family)
MAKRVSTGVRKGLCAKSRFGLEIDRSTSRAPMCNQAAKRFSSKQRLHRPRRSKRSSGPRGGSLSRFGPHLQQLRHSTGYQSSLAETEDSDSDFDKIIAFDLRGVYLCMKYEIGHTRKAGGGAIVNPCSVSDIIGNPGMLRVAAEHGVIGLTKAFAVHYATCAIFSEAASQAGVPRILRKRHDLLQLRRAVQPLQEVWNRLLHPSLTPYLEGLAKDVLEGNTGVSQDKSGTPERANGSATYATSQNTTGQQARRHPRSSRSNPKISLERCDSHCGFLVR